MLLALAALIRQALVRMRTAVLGDLDDRIAIPDAGDQDQSNCLARRNPKAWVERRPDGARRRIRRRQLVAWDWRKSMARAIGVDRPDGELPRLAAAREPLVRMPRRPAAARKALVGSAAP
jgi:hypothetical protein